MIIRSMGYKMTCIQLCFFVYLSYLYIISIVINGGGSD